ncbi:protein phosphatase slingshot [Anaeramoeba flamelloides]|uniref:Protein phosphatase slingshot n=1 Tax=Anaeramoeba flamelloides TaxID=1746091 RepID=A0AAV8AJS7_9EUKA|nr:protein phosphatase slingshot [Anaeramoeba flamelloides]
MSAASDLELLQKNEITHILNVSHEQNNLTKEFNILHVSSRDIFSFLILANFETFYEFIYENGFSEKCNPNNKILIHCSGGVSRSASALISFLMKYKNWEYQRALNFVKEKHQSANPNPSFANQLKLWHQMGFSLEGTTKHHKVYTNMKILDSVYLLVFPLGALKRKDLEQYKIKRKESSLQICNYLSQFPELFNSKIIENLKSLSSQEDSDIINLISNFKIFSYAPNYQTNEISKNPFWVHFVLPLLEIANQK